MAGLQRRGFPEAAKERGAGDYWVGGLGGGHQRPYWLPTGPSFRNWPLPGGAAPASFVLPKVTAIQILQNFQGNLAIHTSRVSLPGTGDA